MRIKNWRYLIGKEAFSKGQWEDFKCVWIAHMNALGQYEKTKLKFWQLAEVMENTRAKE